jgi:hypothetical protein
VAHEHRQGARRPDRLKLAACDVGVPAWINLMQIAGKHRQNLLNVRAHLRVSVP